MNIIKNLDLKIKMDCCPYETEIKTFEKFKKLIEWLKNKNFKHITHLQVFITPNYNFTDYSFIKNEYKDTYNCIPKILKKHHFENTSDLINKLLKTFSNKKVGISLLIGEKTIPRFMAFSINC
jgi:hypothetical protein